jgi:diguanylate cyclase (GGDEF)-like protein
MKHAARILIVDDELSNRKLLEALLRPEGYITLSACNGEEALAMVAQDPPDLILLDVMMPVLDGYQVASLLKADHATANIPIIMVTAQIDRGARLAGLHSGAEEFLTKPVDRAELWLRVRNLLRLKELSDFLQNQGALLEQQVQARTADVQHMAQYDALTGLPNRILFKEALAKSLVHAAAGGWQVAVFGIDLDHFKNVNDSLGHTLGDRMLVQVGERLAACAGIRDGVGRLGGDEFALAVLLEDGQKGAARMANRIRDALRGRYRLGTEESRTSASIGISLYPDDGATPEVLLANADKAMYSAKQAGRDTSRFFTAQMNAEVQARLQLELSLRRAVENSEFVLHYQPKVEIASGRIVGVEALLRWQRPGHGLVLPTEFIPMLEDIGLINRVGSLVIATVCKQMGRWLRSSIGPVQVSVNVASRQFLDGDLAAEVVEALASNQVPPELLELELTESSLMTNTLRTMATLQELRQRGVKISIDDFGTGYSSLAYLGRFPIDKLKIDIEFVREITGTGNGAAIALTIIRMAHSLNMEVIAEGVETAEQLEFLREHQCEQMQGFHFSAALPVSELETLLDAQAHRLPLALGQGKPADRPH